jgi:hypothetical protein
LCNIKDVNKYNVYSNNNYECNNITYY